MGCIQSTNTAQGISNYSGHNTPSSPSSGGNGNVPLELQLITSIPSSTIPQQSIPHRPIESSWRKTLIAKLLGKTKASSSQAKAEDQAWQNFDTVPTDQTLVVENLRDWERSDNATIQSMQMLSFKSNVIDENTWNGIKTRLSTLSKLRFLSLDECQGISAEWLRGLPPTQHLKITDCDWTSAPEFWDTLPRNLETLIISGISLRSLKGLPVNLQSLDISYCRFSEPLLKDLPTGLRTLYVDGCQVSDEELNAALRTMPHLSEVHVSLCNNLTSKVKSGLPDSVRFVGLLDDHA